MKPTSTTLTGRRAELIVELFFQDLDAQSVAKPADDFGYDFLVAFRNDSEGINTFMVQVKATDQPVTPRFAIERKMFERLAHSNIPAMLLVVNVKQNRLYYAWLTPSSGDGQGKGESVKVHVTEIDDVVREKLREQLHEEHALVA